MLFEPASRGPVAPVRRAPAPLSNPAQGAAGRAGSHSWRPSPWDVAGLLAGVLLIFAITAVNAHGRIFWEDEMLGWSLLHDPSRSHMIRAWNLGADGGGFSFYLLGRAWFRLFGSSALAFRLFSSACFGLAFAATWAALRRVYSVGFVAFATFNSFFFSPPLTMHFLEGRFYGLLVMSVALALWLALVLDEECSPTPAWGYAAAFAVHGLLTTSHVLGIVFSGFVLGGTVLLDRLRGRLRWRLYATVAASWLLLLPEKTSILAAGRVGKPHFWTEAPTRLELGGAWSGFSNEIRLVLLVLALASALALGRWPGGLWPGLANSYRQRRPIYVLAGCLLLVPVAFLVQGLLGGTWLFTPRYLQPLVLGVAWLTAELATLARGLPWLASLRSAKPWLRSAAITAATTLYAAALLIWVFHHVAQYTPEAPDFTAQLTAHLPHELPVVVEDAFTFTDLMGKQADSGVPYTFLLDWPWALNPAAPRVEVTQYHLMQNWKLAGYYADHIEPVEAFLRDHDRFLIVHDGPIDPDPALKPEIGNPLAERLAHDPAYEVRPFFTLDRVTRDQQRDTVWMVCHGHCNGLPASLPTRCQLSARGTTCCTGAACKLPAVPAPPRFWKVSAWWPATPTN